MKWPLALVPEEEEPRETCVRRCGNLSLNAESEDGFRGGRPSFGQAEPTAVAHALRALPDTAVSDEVDIGVRHQRNLYHFCTADL